MLLDDIKKREAREEQEYMQSIENINQTKKEEQNSLKQKLTSKKEICGIDADILRETIAMAIALGIYAALLTYVSVTM